MNIAPQERRPESVFNVRLGLFIAGFVGVCVAVASMRSIEWAVVKWTLRNRFPQVQWITTGELSQWLQDKRRQPPVLLDVRTPEEWEVSHLPGARRVDPDADPAEVMKDVANDSPIVTYCAVGYRSAEMVERLQKAGFSNVRNLEGSIFQWANEKRPLVRGDQPVQQVHPYDGVWGKLLDEKVRAPLAR